MHVFQVAVSTAAGTTDPSPATWLWEVDATPPSLTLVDVPAASSPERRPVVELAATDAHGPVDLTCSLDGAAFAPCASPLPLLAFGPHSLDVRAVDALGNLATRTHAWTVADLCAVDNGGCGAVEIATCAQPVSAVECDCAPGYVLVAGACALPWLQDAYLKASNPDPDDAFGWTVAMSGDGTRLAVGAIYEASAATGVDGDQANNGVSQAGAVYVFVRAGDTWVQEAYLKASNPGVDDYFGIALALSADGSRLAVGASGEASAATGSGGDEGNDLAPQAGAVYVFTRAGSVWAQEAYLKASNTDLGDYFGIAVALSADGDRLAVGAHAEDSAATGAGGDQASNAALQAGAVYVFTRAGSAWAQEAYLKASNTDGDDYFGHAVTLSADGGRLVVGAFGEASDAAGDPLGNAAPSAGAAYVFARTGTAWSQEAYLKAAHPDPGDTFGWSVAMSADGDRVAVGAYVEASDATGTGGDETSNAAPFAGAVYVFARGGTTWQQEAYLKASNTDASDVFGTSLAWAADGSRLVVGAYGEASDATGINGDQASNAASLAGAAYVFARAGTSWTQEAYLKASATDPGDALGLRVAQSADGRLLAVGAYAEDGSVAGVDGDPTDDGASGAGAVYTFQLNE
ncbi:MAG: hypothetical protein R2939_19145 [Kofleriaceae bacterium]